MKKEPAVHVTPGKMIVVAALGLFDDESYQVRYVIDVKDQCDINKAPDIPYSPKGEALTLSNMKNPIMLTTPGYYRIVPVGVVNDNAKLFYSEVPAPKDVYC